MWELALLVPLGVAVGAFGTLVGAGGGFVLVPLLLLIYPDRDPENLTAISLLVVCANAASGSVAYARQRRIDYASARWFVFGTLPGAISGAFVVRYIPRDTFEAIFAVSLTALGLYLFLHRQGAQIRDPVRGRGVTRRFITDRAGDRFIYAFQLWKGVLLSAAVGFFSSLLGIGGGVVHVPVMTTILHFPVHIATATSQFVLLFMSAEGTAVHVASGTLGWGRELGEAGLISLGVIPGAQAGARLSRRLRGDIILRVLAGTLILVGLRLGYGVL